MTEEEMLDTGMMALRRAEEWGDSVAITIGLKSVATRWIIPTGFKWGGLGCCQGQRIKIRFYNMTRPYGTSFSCFVSLQSRRLGPFCRAGL